MSNSSLVSYTNISPNRNSPRNHVIDTITIHCVVGQLSAKTICDMFAASDYKASCNYAIGTDGEIGLCVEEKDRSWCSSNGDNDHRAITIECASDKTHPYAVNAKVYASLIRLLVDICQRNGIPELRWQGDKSLVGQTDKQNMTVHRWFKNKACPGDYLYNLHGQIAAEVNAQLKGGNPSTGETMYRVQTGAFQNKSNADAMLAQVKAAGFDTYMVQSGGMYKIQVGAYTVKSNADAMLAKVQAAGFKAFITTEGGAAVKPVNPCPVPTRIIYYTAPMQTGADVKWVQWALAQAGYNIKADGIWGPASDKALKAYQAHHGLVVDGKCGPATRACMMGD